MNLNNTKIIYSALFLVSILLTACGGGGDSSPTAPTTAPSAPTGVSAPAGNGQSTISWTAATGATSYNIYWSTTTGVTKATGTKIAGATSPYTQTGLTNGTTYYYVVTAVNGTGESSDSSQVSGTPAATSSTTALMGGSIQGNQLTLANAVTTFAGSAGVFGSTNGTGIAARFASPNGVTTDGTNLYVVDAGNSAIRKIVIATGVVATLAGSGSPGVSGSTDGTGSAARFLLPSGITTDGTNLYVADSWNHTIRKIVIATGAVTTLAGSAGITGSTDGTGAAASFNEPHGITTDGTNLYVADSYNQTIRKIVIATGAVTTFAGSAGVFGTTDATGAAARFGLLFGITTDGTNLYVADTSNSTIRKVVISTGVVTTLAGSAGSTGTGAAANFYSPVGITADGTNLYVADTNSHTIRKIVISTGAVTTLAGTWGISGSTDATGTAAMFYMPHGITTDGTSLYVADNNNNTIRKIQ